jgi:hypothetical protein
MVDHQSDDEVFLNDVWNVYFHDPFDVDWTTTSYIRLASIGSVDEYWENMSFMKSNVHKGIFFIMREYVFPCWDDPNNINGGCLSIKILKDNLADFWEELCIKLLGETLLKEDKREHWNLINGISTSPKKHFCIIKIWVKDDTLSNKDYFDIPPKYYGDILYKSNLENIHQDTNTH